MPESFFSKPQNNLLLCAKGEGNLPACHIGGIFPPEAIQIYSALPSGASRYIRPAECLRWAQVFHPSGDGQRPFASYVRMCSP